MELTKFFESRDIRMFENDGVVSVAAADLARLLGYKQTKNITDLCRDKYRGVAISETLGGRQKIITVTQHGVFEILAKTTKPIAERFQDWLYEEVLPSIAKNKAYVDTSATTDNIKNTLTPYQQLSMFMWGMPNDDPRKPVIELAQRWLIHHERYDQTKHKYQYTIDLARALELAGTGEEPPIPDTSDIDVYLTPPTEHLFKTLDVDSLF